MAGLQVGWALGCSGCLGLGSAVPAPPMFLGTQPPYATKALIIINLCQVHYLFKVEIGPLLTYLTPGQKLH